MLLANDKNLDAIKTLSPQIGIKEMTRNITKVDASERQEIANKNTKKNDTRREQTLNDDEIITGYKPFDADFKHQGYQYGVGKTFKYEGKNSPWFGGFNFFHKDPFDVFEYFPLVDEVGARPTRLAKVSTAKQDAILSRQWPRGVTSKMSIDKEIPLDELINEQIEEAYRSEGEASKNTNQLVVDSNGSVVVGTKLAQRIVSNKKGTTATLLRHSSLLLSSGDDARLMSSERSNNLFAIGENTELLSSGRKAKIYSNGGYSKVSVTGEHSQLEILGDKVNVSSSGLHAALYVDGKGSSVAGSGLGSAVNVKGVYASVSSSGNSSTLNVTGTSASVSSSGLSAELTVKGDFVATASSGEDAELRITGNRASVASSGAFSELTVTGNDARMAVVGDKSQVTYEGKGGVISVLGIGAKFRGSEGTLVSAVVYDKESKPIDIITGRIGENGLKPDTLYTVSDGEFVEVEA